MNKPKAIIFSKTEDSPQYYRWFKSAHFGVWFAKNRKIKAHYQRNFQSHLQKMNMTCKAWSNRTLSWKGKVTVFNSLVISLIQYVAANTITQERVFREFKDMAYVTSYGQVSMAKLLITSLSSRSRMAGCAWWS